MKRNSIQIWASLVILGIILSAGCGKGGREWGGSISAEGGVTVVKNPIGPKYGPEVFTLVEELSIGESEGSEEYMFQQVTGIAIGMEDRIYAVDYGAKQVKVYDQHGRHVRTFGNAGEGPGEFQLPRTIEGAPWNEIIIGDINRITYFDLEGEYKRNLPMTRVRMLGLQHDADGNILGLVINRKNESYELQKFDSELNHLLSFASSPLPSSGEYRSKRSLYFSVLRWDLTSSGQVVCGYAGDGYVINVFDGSGSLNRRIEKEYDPVEVDQAEAENELKDLPAEVRESYYAPDHFPPFRTLYADDQGRIFVLTYEDAPDGQGSFYDVFDSEGIYIARLPLKSPPRVFKNDRMYAVEEDEEGFHVIKRYRIGWNL